MRMQKKREQSTLSVNKKKLLFQARIYNVHNSYLIIIFQKFTWMMMMTMTTDDDDGFLLLL